MGYRVDGDVDVRVKGVLWMPLVIVWNIILLALLYIHGLHLYSLRGAMVLRLTPYVVYCVLIRECHVIRFYLGLIYCIRLILGMSIADPTTFSVHLATYTVGLQLGSVTIIKNT